MLGTEHSGKWERILCRGQFVFLLVCSATTSNRTDQAEGDGSGLGVCPDPAGRARGGESGMSDGDGEDTGTAGFR